MEKITSLSPEEFSKFTIDSKTNMITVPEGYVLERVKSVKEHAEEDLVVALPQFELMTPPSQEELIEYGKTFHPYYQMEFHISVLNDIIKEKSK